MKRSLFAVCVCALLTLAWSSASYGATPKQTLATVNQPKVRVLVVGDSTAFTLAWSLNAKVLTTKYHYALLDAGSIGCGLVEGPAVQYKGVTYPTPAECKGVPPPADAPLTDQPWPVQWKADIAKFRPNVVVLLAGRWEIANRIYQGAWTNILNPTFSAYVKQQLEAASNLIAASGARLVLLTSPCTDEATQPNGDPWPESDPERRAIYNQLVREVASQNPGNDSVYDLNALVCPDNKYSATFNGIAIRRPEGVHFTNQAGLALGPSLMPPILAVGRAQMAHAAPASKHRANHVPS